MSKRIGWAAEAQLHDPLWRKEEIPGRSLFEIIEGEVNLSKTPAGLDNRDLHQGPPGRSGGLALG